MGGKVIDRDMGYKAFARKMRIAAKGDPHVTVGVHEKDNALYPDGEATTADVATFNEFGTETIPERSFLRSTVDENRRKYADGIERAVGRWIDDKATLEQGLGLVGAQAKGDVQRKITTLKEPPNAPATIARKGSSNPLIDRGQLRQSIDYEVKADT